MQLLSSHNRSFGVVNNPNGSPHIAENMELFRAEGWKSSNAPEAIQMQNRAVIFLLCCVAALHVFANEPGSIWAVAFGQAIGWKPA